MARRPTTHNTQTLSNAQTISEMRRVLEIFNTSGAQIRPHYFLTGPSGSSKTHTVEALAHDMKLGFMEINAAQLTKEGTSGNSLSKALTPLLNRDASRPMVVFVDEFDKLFIVGNTNTQLAHETTLGVQVEFLKVLEGKKTSVYGDYGHYVEVSCENLLFIFAGAFNGEENITLDRLRELGIKTEFLGRVGLIYSMVKLSLDDLRRILVESTLLANYLLLFPDAKKEDVVTAVMAAVQTGYEKNTIGARILPTLLHRYFISGGKLTDQQVKESTFQRTLSLGKPDTTH